MVKRYNIPEFDDGSPLTNEAKLEFCMRQFELECPSEDASADIVFDICYPSGGRCQCGSSNIERESGSRSFKCKCCGQTTWFTAGTMFHQVKKLRPHLLYDTLLENGVSVNASQFSRIVKIDNKTARHIFGKFTTVIESDMRDGVVSVPSKKFVNTFHRRSFDTPAGEHPVKEQERMEMAANESKQSSQEQPVEPDSPGSSSQNDSIDIALNRAGDLAGALAESLKEVYWLLSDKPLHFDYLCSQIGMESGDLSACLTFLEFERLVKRKDGDWYVRDILPEATNAVAGDLKEDAQTIDSAVHAFVAFIRMTFDGIARKYLQKYLAYWWYIKRTGEHTGLLIDKCLQFGEVRSGMTRSYVTHLIVKLAA